jgi:DNA modification methylase
MINISLIYGDTIEQMKSIQDKSIDFICCDLPYGMTAPL